MSPEILLTIGIGAALLGTWCVLVACRIERAPKIEPDPPHAPKPPIDGAELGYVHPLGWPVRIIQGLPVAIGPHGHSRLWCARTGSWAWCPEVLADEARERIKLEDTQVMRNERLWTMSKPLPAGWVVTNVNWNHQ